MKRIAAVIVILLFHAATSQARGRNCKPDISTEDKITKEQVVIWSHELFATSFMGSLVSTSEVGITATVGRYGSVNAVNLVIQKREESATNAAFESAYRAAVGKQFYFGFKSGEPIAFTVTDVSNAANVQQGLFQAKGVTTVVLSAALQDGALGALRDALTSRQIDAVRVLLAGDVRIEKSIDDDNGRAMMEKFVCFFQALDQRGINLSRQGQSATAPSGSENAQLSVDAVSAQGKYMRKGKGSDFIDLSHGMFSLLQDGHSAEGTYEVHGDTLTLIFPRARAHAKAQIIGNTIKDNEGIIWEKQPETSKSSAQLTVDQIIQMVAAKVPDDVIISTIQNSNSKFDLNPEALINLKKAGVSDAVIRAMAR